VVRDYPAEVALLGDAGAGLAALLDELGPMPNEPPGYAGGDGLAERRSENRATLVPKQRRHVKVLEAMRAALPDDAFVAADSTQLAYTGNAWFPCLRPRSWFFPVGYGTLGFALPAAIGAKLAAPERTGAVIVGDGGFLFTAQELATAVDHKLPLAVVLWNNDAYGQIKDDMRAKGDPEIGVDLRNPDFLMLARAFGCRAERPDSLDGFAQALVAAREHDAPTVIEVREDAGYLD
jgi:5-guanidino-2-oxopentanoate decarboxylase